MPGIYCHWQTQTTISFATSQGYTSISLIALSIATVCHGLMVYLFVHQWQMGFLGICLASSLHFFVRLLVAVSVISFRPELSNAQHLDNPVRLFSRESTTPVANQIRLGLFGMCMGIWGVWAFDVFTLIASYLSIYEVSAQTIMRSLGLTTFMVPFGLSMASGMLIGRSIGQDSKAKVRHYFKACMVASLVVGFCQIMLLMTLES